MTDNTASTATTDAPSTSPSDVRAVVSRVSSLSIFFVGVGLFSAIGLLLHQAALFTEFQLTYFAVGGAIGVVGLLLWLVTR